MDTRAFKLSKGARLQPQAFKLSRGCQAATSGLQAFQKGPSLQTQAFKLSKGSGYNLKPSTLDPWTLDPLDPLGPWTPWTPGLLEPWALEP